MPPPREASDAPAGVVLRGGSRRSENVATTPTMRGDASPRRRTLSPGTRARRFSTTLETLNVRREDVRQRRLRGARRSLPPSRSSARAKSAPIAARLLDLRLRARRGARDAKRRLEAAAAAMAAAPRSSSSKEGGSISPRRGDSRRTSAAVARAARHAEWFSPRRQRPARALGARAEGRVGDRDERRRRAPRSRRRRGVRPSAQRENPNRHFSSSSGKRPSQSTRAASRRARVARTMIIPRRLFLVR